MVRDSTLILQGEIRPDLKIDPRFFLRRGRRGCSPRSVLPDRSDGPIVLEYRVGDRPGPPVWINFSTRPRVRCRVGRNLERPETDKDLTLGSSGPITSRRLRDEKGSGSSTDRVRRTEAPETGRPRPRGDTGRLRSCVPFFRFGLRWGDYTECPKILRGTGCYEIGVLRFRWNEGRFLSK